MNAPIEPRLRTRDLLLYSLPGTGVSFLFALVLVMYMKFATDVLHLAPAVIGAIFFASKIWAAISDPITGQLSDATQSRLGRRKPWLLASSVPLGLTSIAMWAPPEGMGASILTLWITISVFAFYTAFTLFEVPHMALGAELTFDLRERNRVFGTRQLLRSIGLFAAFGIGSALLEDSSTARTNAFWLAIGAGVFTTVTIVAAVLRLPAERVDHSRRGGSSLYASLRDVARNPHARILLFVFFIEQMGIGGIGVLVPYVVEYVIKRPDMISEMLIIYVTCTVGSIPVWVWLGGRYDKRSLWIFAMWMSLVGFGSLLFVGEGTLGIMVFCALLAGTAGGCGPTLGQAIKADVIDWDEYETGERKEGAYFAAWSFTSKLAAGVMIGLVGVSLQAAGFEEGADQPEVVRSTMLFLMGGMPVLGLGLGILIFRRFTLDRAEHTRIRDAIERGVNPGASRTR